MATKNKIPKLKLSEEMHKCIAAIQQYGCLIRYPGGFWSASTVEFHKKYDRLAHKYTEENDYPKWYFGIQTLEALEKRGIVNFTQWKEGRGGRFPIEAKATPNAKEILSLYSPAE